MGFKEVINSNNILYITDLINQLVQVLKRELAQLRDNVQELKEVGELDLVKP